jgi:hypothetical protein
VAARGEGTRKRAQRCLRSALRLAHYYRALRVLWRHKARIEQALYQKGLDLFNQPLDLVFFDTTSLYFEGRGPAGLAKLGKSKDHRPDHPRTGRTGRRSWLRWSRSSPRGASSG